MASSAEPAPSLCTVCGKDAKYRCAECLDGLTIYGEPKITEYCGKDCQIAHWTSHKAICKLRNARKHVFRAGDVLRQIYEAHAALMPKEKESIRDQLNAGSNMIQWGTELSPPVAMYGMIESALQGAIVNCEEIGVDVKRMPVTGPMSPEQEVQSWFPPTTNIYCAELSDTATYILDITGAQFGRPSSVVPSNQFAEHFIERYIGKCRGGHLVAGFDENLQAVLRTIKRTGRVSEDSRKIMLIARLRGHMKAALYAASEAVDDIADLGALVKLPAPEYESKKAILLAHFATKMAELLDQARQAGSFDRWVARMVAGSK
ncbi:hypothetical protein B0A48_05430 [Cryoendolithus antarcticus]|uniref:MYND-type domain-containing protein n=1 Tax=Cryoendolithus antarcticus TaxID=1507870 RepID=A0A1V8TIR5_9PEZI|nr:hypothetical protein B0A48_05430 [Cryoendolithus antarcticus]